MGKLHRGGEGGRSEIDTVSSIEADVWGFGRRDDG